MRGHVDPQNCLFSYFSIEERIPVEHPLRAVKAQADVVLASMSPAFEAMYADDGRPSVAPERLLKASLLIAFYSVRSERLFCEQLAYNMLFRWFLDMDLETKAFDHSTFSLNRSRLIEHDIARAFFAGIVEQARAQQLLSDEHFTVDGTLIEAWASFKSFKRKDGEPPRSGGDGTGMVDFRGEKRSNATHESTTDPQAKLMRKGKGQPARLSYGAHALMENRHGLLIDLAITVRLSRNRRRWHLWSIDGAGRGRACVPSAPTRAITIKHSSNCSDTAASPRILPASTSASHRASMHALPGTAATPSASESANASRRSSAG